MSLVGEANGGQIYCCPWTALLEVVPECDLLLVDAPYSAKTHAGHDGGTDAANRLKDDVPWKRSNGKFYVPAARKTISYAAWGEAEVAAFVAAWAPRTRGWFVTVTDHVLAPLWTAALEAQGRYVFAPIPFVHPGRGVRLSGDGPSSWTCWIVVARRCCAPWAKWGTLPGAYVQPKGKGYRSPVVGGKTTWLALQLCLDYAFSKKQPPPPGYSPLVVDPCCGAGVFGVGALQAGARFIGGDVDAEHAALARRPPLRSPASRMSRAGS